MIKFIDFKNFKALRDARLPLSRFTLIVGPNGSGKSSAMQAISMASTPGDIPFSDVATANLQHIADALVSITINWVLDDHSLDSSRKKINHPRLMTPIPSDAFDASINLRSWWQRKGNVPSRGGPDTEANFALETISTQEIFKKLASFRIFSFDAQALAEAVLLRPKAELAPNGSNLAGVLENLRDSEPERFEALNEELRRWLPEFDRVLFDTPAQGQKALLLRTRAGQHKIKATDLSHGTLFALAFLTITYLPNPPAIMCFEEPERGIHPRLLREIRDAMYRLCYPEEYGDRRSPVQVIATTHSPYLLDLYKDYPEEIVIAHKDEAGIHFERLSEKPDFSEFLQDAPLGEVWYSGVLGGVPLKP